MSWIGGGEPQDVKLSEQEQKLVAKLLSDPTYFPLEFRTWLKNYIEGAGLTVTASQIVGGTAKHTGLPAGIILPVGGTAAIPVDSVACDGAARSRVTYKALFDAIGTSWGGGDGSTTFNSPDLRDRSLFGAGAIMGVATTDGHPFGSRGGYRHYHTGGSHGHTFGREVVFLTPGETAYSILGAMGSHDVGTDAAGLTIGPGYNLDGPSWAGVILVITTGKTA